MLLDCLETAAAGSKADRVELLTHGPEWIVRLTEKGAVDERHFEVESHARAFASGQSFRPRRVGAGPHERPFRRTAGVSLVRAFGRHLQSAAAPLGLDAKRTWRNR